jgi:hypothetical protein
MESPSHTLELPTGPIREYFAPWTAKKEVFVDSVMLREYERLYKKARRTGNIQRFGLSIPMINLFGKLFTSFAMFTAVSAIVFGTAVIVHHAFVITGDVWILKTLRVETTVLFTLNLILFLASVTRNLYKTVIDI